MDWLTALCILSPFILLWGWVKYLQIPNRLDWRSRASLAGLSAPLLSIGVWAVMLLLAHSTKWPNAETSAIRHLTTVGVWIPIVGMMVGFAGHPRLILAILPTSIGTLMFWFGTTLP